MTYQTKFISGGYKYPVSLIKDGDRLWVKFGYNKALIEKIRLMEGAKYHGFDDPPIKQWTIKDSLRNWFQIAVLEGKNPYELYDRPLLNFRPRRECVYDHQVDMFQHGITRQYCIIAAEPAVGKTLTAIEIMEWLAINKGINSWFYVAPRGALISVKLEFEQWHSIVQPQFFTYEKLKSIIENWPQGSPPPQGVVFDESQKLRTPTAQRSQAAKHLSESIRKEWGEKGAVILMTGTPSPLDPGNWFHQAEVACSGFIQEGSLEKFRRRLGVFDEQQSDSGQKFLALKGWRDSEEKCHICGKLESDSSHNAINAIEKWYHPFQKGVNEVAKLYERMKGLVIVKLKKSCLSIPDKIFKVIRCKPTQSVINAAKIIVAQGYSGLQTAILLRELSDGFAYKKVEAGTQTCPSCEGKKIQDDWVFTGPEEMFESQQEISPEYYEKITKACNYCNGTGESVRYDREIVQVPCPKEDTLLDLIDEYEDIGRMVVYAGFTGSVNRCVDTFLKQEWNVVRVDGRGWWSNVPGRADELYKRFKYDKTNFPRCAFVAQPGAGGIGLNLQVSPVAVFYSNDNNGESRQQSVERIHRPGMDEARGATVIDLIHLPSDELILQAHDRKKKLQDITLGEFKTILERTA